MKIATYNLWNENKGKGNRLYQLVNEINSVDADIIGLQEVTENFYSNFLLTKTNYDISPENNLSASDHYGVIAEVDFIK